MKKKVAITGSTGFIGSRFVDLCNQEFQLSPISVVNKMPTVNELFEIETMLHLGGLAHQLKNIPSQIFQNANFINTKLLADICKSSGVKHFIFISSIKVFGNTQTEFLNELSPCDPGKDYYGRSKLDAEKYLLSIQSSEFRVTIIRPPLVYGPGVKGNLEKLLFLCNSNQWLPFRGINNCRTIIFLDSLVELLKFVINNESAGLILAGDSECISTENLVKKIRKHMGKPYRLFKIPSFAIFLLKIIHPNFYNRLFGSLVMDVNNSYKRIGFKSKIDVEKGFEDMVKSHIKIL
jgi:nucleoside-diphosphate-sugar epimerase